MQFVFMNDLGLLEKDLFWTSKTDGKIPGGVYKLKLDANKNINNVCI
jgi:hypothetical protein